MPLPRPPSRVDTLTFPSFGMSWFANPSNGFSVLALAGGGGSAKTGVTNKICLRINGAADQYIDTGDSVCVAVVVYEWNQRLWLIGALGDRIRRYAIDLSGQEDHSEQGEVQVEKVQVKDGEDHQPDLCNAVATHASGEVVAVGCESGLVHVYRMDYEKNTFALLHTCTGHTNAVCAVRFAIRSPLVVSSAKDGTAKVWNNGELLSSVLCDVVDPKDPPPKRKTKRKMQVMVRGCDFGDLEGKVFYTVASERRGKTFLSRWVREENKYVCQERTVCHKVPVSSSCLAADGSFMALGGVDGSVLLWDVHQWKLQRQFPEIHDLPVTCIGARPFSLPLREDETYDGVQMSAVSASADSKLALLTLTRRVPRKQRSNNGKSGSGGAVLISWTTLLFWFPLVGYALYQLGQEAYDICHKDWPDFVPCLVDQVLLAPPSRPGIMIPPH